MFMAAVTRSRWDLHKIVRNEKKKQLLQSSKYLLIKQRYGKYVLNSQKVAKKIQALLHNYSARQRQTTSNR